MQIIIDETEFKKRIEDISFLSEDSSDVEPLVEVENVFEVLEDCIIPK